MTEHKPLPANDVARTSPFKQRHATYMTTTPHKPVFSRLLSDMVQVHDDSMKTAENSEYDTAREGEDKRNVTG